LENFLIAKRLKQNKYKETFARMFFWRTKQQQEVDFVELKNGKLAGYEFKWNARKHYKLPKTFVKTYGTESYIIDKKNFENFVKISPIC